MKTILVYGNDCAALKRKAESLKAPGVKVMTRASNQFAAHCVEECDQVVLLDSSEALINAYGDKINKGAQKAEKPKRTYRKSKADNDGTGSSGES